LEQKDGMLLPKNSNQEFQAPNVMESSAGRDGIIILIPRSGKALGISTRSMFL